MEEISQTPPGEVKKEKNIGMAILAYILFFVPLLTEAKKDPFVKFHVKQGLVLFIAEVILWWIPFVGWFFLGPLISILALIGLIMAVMGREWKIPLIWNIAEKIKL